jgi:TonB-linked SusC/RagA family outer membrane protein
MLICLQVHFSIAQKKISGVVTGKEDGVPLPGVTVTIKEIPGKGTITDFDGKYLLDLPSGVHTLVFSFVGMQTQEIVSGQSSEINVSLGSSSVELEDVVVTALGIKREKKSLGYSVQDVKGGDISKTSNPNLVTALSGKISGVEIRQSSGMPGASAQIFIRGARSFDGDNTPLYVIDGMPVASTNDFDFGNNGTSGTGYSTRSIDLDPNDIESISVLKGQAAAALYGLRASNGVIVITTKSGKNAKDKPVVSYSTGLTFDQISRFPELQQTYAHGTGGNFRVANSFSWGPKITDLPADLTYGGNTQGQQGKYWQPQKSEWVEPKAYNNAKNFFETGVTFNNSINLSQSGQMGSYSIGLGSTNQKGIIPSSKMDRYTAKISGDMKMNDKWRVSFNSNFADTKLNKIPSGNSSILYTVFGCPPSYDLLGTPTHFKGLPYNQISYRTGAVSENPIWSIENNKFAENNKRFFGNTSLTYQPIDWLNIKYQIGLDSYNTDIEEIYAKGSTQTGQVLPEADGYPMPIDLNPAPLQLTGGRIKNQGVVRSVVNSLLNITFDKQFSEKLRGTLLLGNELNEDYSRFWYQTGNDFFVAGWNNMANTAIQTDEEEKDRERSIGFYTNASLEWNHILYLNATGRNDIVSKMPRGNRSFFYPSVSLGFVFTELEAFKNNKAISYGKIRGSYAEVGQASARYKTKIYQKAQAGSGFLDDGVSFPLGGKSGYEPNVTRSGLTVLYNPNLVPQNTISFETGLELKFFNNRLGLDYSYSDQVSRNQIFLVPLAGSVGFLNELRNAGEMSSKSHEIVINATPLKTTDYEWNINISFTKIKNNVNSLAAGVTNISLGGYSDPNIRAQEGDTYPIIYGATFQRDSLGRILVDEDPKSPDYGFPLIGGAQKIGVIAPDFLMSFNTSIRYKFITLSAQIDWKQGGDIFSGSNQLIDYYGTSKRTEDRTTPFIYDAYKADGKKNDIQRGGPNDPKAYENLQTDILGNCSESAIYENSYMKLREISLSVSLPKSLISPLKLQNVSLSCSVRNILLWSTLPNFDPESSQGDGNMQGGMDYMSLPQTKSYGFGLNVTF